MCFSFWRSGHRPPKRQASLPLRWIFCCHGSGGCGLPSCFAFRLPLNKPYIWRRKKRALHGHVVVNDAAIVKVIDHHYSKVSFPIEP